MAIVNVTYVETLVKTVAVNVPNTFTDEQKIAQAILVGKQHYFEAKVILGGDDLDSREICAEYKQVKTEYENF
ncbi:hypothetical protein KII93_05615 [Leuconostoc gelidum subsp. gasicomitatum]|uniref:hypothetical protein n=1 Tax=Leuconostoc gasicomitatum TaxID=115778 RepID=UPI001CC67041|nr:hypothetical protein [Leuconostoc gasicomitatum]MBZ5947945.1 hypothetical protein [Leuconostoc gasicomitatum]